MQSPLRTIWRSPEEIVEIAFQRSPVVMMNEAHSGRKRCIRTRQIGQRILPVAHQAGVRHLAMEALYPHVLAQQYNGSRYVSPDAGPGYLSHPEMRVFIQTALDLGWTLIPYEADGLQWLSDKYSIVFQDPNEPNELFDQLQRFQTDLVSMGFTNWREEQQARNLIKALQSLPLDTRMLVWCGNGHNSKAAVSDWSPMGYRFQQLRGSSPFVIDQTRTVRFDSWDNQLETELSLQSSDELIKHGGTAGFLREEVPPTLEHYHDLGADAFLFSNQNELE